MIFPINVGEVGLRVLDEALADIAPKPATPSPSSSESASSDPRCNAPWPRPQPQVRLFTHPPCCILGVCSVTTLVRPTSRSRSI